MSQFRNEPRLSDEELLFLLVNGGLAFENYEIDKNNMKEANLMTEENEDDVIVVDQQTRAKPVVVADSNKYAQRVL